MPQLIKFKKLTRLCLEPIAVLISFSCIINLLQLAIPIYTLQVFDNVLSSQSTDTLLYLSMIVAFALFIMFLMSVIRARILNRFGNWFARHLMLRVLPETPYKMMESEKNHTIYKEIQALKQGLGGQGVIALFDVPWIFVYLAVLYVMHPLMCLVGVVAVLFLLVTTIATEITTKTLKEENKTYSGFLEKIINYFLNNPSDTIAQGTVTPIATEFNKTNLKSYSIEDEIHRRSTLFSQLSKVLRLYAQVSIMGCGAYLVILQDITPGMMIAGSILLGKALAPVDQLIGNWLPLTRTKDSFYAIKDYFEAPEIQHTELKLPEPKGKMSIENIFYRPESLKKNVIDDISLEIKEGEFIAIVGPSAAGKSTLAKLLIGALKPDEGVVRLDNVDITHWNRDHVGPYIGYMSQRTELYPTTIKHFISRMQPATDEQILEAAQLANLHEIILSLPEGYETVIGPGGMPLSDGLRQRVVLASTLFGRPKLLILDEPNSCLDKLGEQALNTALVKAKAWGATIIIISHRMEIVKLADRIIVLAQGKVTEEIDAQQVSSHLEKIHQSRKNPVKRDNDESYSQRQY